MFTMIILALTGALLGSFIATLAERWDDGFASWGLGRSRCVQCGTALRPVDLVPIISWLWLRGRCRYCAQPIGWRLLGCELVAAFVLVVSMSYLPSPDNSFAAVAGLILLLLAMIDLQHWRLPHLLTIGLALLGIIRLAVGWFAGPAGSDFVLDPAAWSVHLERFGQVLTPALLAALITWSLLRLLQLVYRRLRGQDGLGGGDVMLLSAACFWLPLEHVMWAVMVAGLVGLAGVGGQRLLARTGVPPAAPLTWQTPLPFGPALAIGIWSMLLWHGGLRA